MPQEQLLISAFVTCWKSSFDLLGVVNACSAFKSLHFRGSLLDLRCHVALADLWVERALYGFWKHFRRPAVIMTSLFLFHAVCSEALALTFSVHTFPSGSLSFPVTLYSSLGYPGSTEVMRGWRGVGNRSETETGAGQTQIGKRKYVLIRTGQCAILFSGIWKNAVLSVCGHNQVGSTQKEFTE